MQNIYRLLALNYKRSDTGCSGKNIDIVINRLPRWFDAFYDRRSGRRFRSPIHQTDRETSAQSFPQITDTEGDGGDEEAVLEGFFAYLTNPALRNVNCPYET